MTRLHTHPCAVEGCHARIACDGPVEFEQEPGEDRVGHCLYDNADVLCERHLIHGICDECGRLFDALDLVDGRTCVACAARRAVA